MTVFISEKSFAVIGLSKFGYRVATGLFAAGAEVIAIDEDEHLIQKISDHVTRAVRADAMDEEALEHLGIFDVDVVVIGFRSSFDTAVLLTMTLRKKNTDVHIITQVDTDEKEEAVKRVGGNVTVFPERDIADRVVRRLITPDLVEHMELAPDVAVIEMEVPESYVGRSLADLGIRAKFNVHVIGVVSPGSSASTKNVVIAPSAETVFREGETLLLLGKIENLTRFSAANPA
jgi:trk system potassium uptake protein TrkA